MESIQTAAMQSKKQIFSDTREQAVPCDMMLPEYYPEIEKVLSCSVQFSEESVTLHGDKIGVNANACFTLVYLSSEGRPYSFVANEKYTRLIPCCETAAGDVCLVRQSLSQLDCRATAPRKAEARAVAAVRADVWRREETCVVAGAADPRLELLPGETELFRRSGFYAGTFVLRRSVKLPDACENTTAIVRADARMRVDEAVVIRGKVMLRGSCAVTVTSAGAEGRITAGAEFRQPFSETLDVFGAEEGDQCYYSVGVEEVRADLKSAAAGSDSPEVQITVSCVLITGRQTRQTYLRDAYAPGFSPETAAADLRVGAAVKQTAFSFPFEARAECFDENARQVADAWLTDLRLTETPGESAVTLNGSATVNALLTGGETLSLISRSVAFSFAREQTAGDTDFVFSAFASALSASFDGNGSLLFSGEISVNGFETTYLNARMLTALSLPEDQTAAEEERVVVYYAGAGERLWDIAKAEGGTVRQIKEFNGLQTDETEHAAPLVFSAR